MNTQRCVYFITALTITLFLGCFGISCSNSNNESDKIGVIVTIPPQKEFVSQVGRDKVEVSVMVPPGMSPHNYEPTPSQMIAVSKADLYAKVGSGVEFEITWLDKLIDQNKDMLIVDCAKGINLIETNVSYQPDHSVTQAIHDEEHEYHPEGMDPHIWMSPNNAMLMVNNICSLLIDIDPFNKSYYESNRDRYLEQLAQVDQTLHTNLSDITNRVFMVYHPAFGYLAHDYGLTMLPIEGDGKEPTAAGLANLINQAKEYQIKVVFVEPQFDPKKAKAIAHEIGGTVAIIDSLAEDYTHNLIMIQDALIQSME